MNLCKIKMLIKYKCLIIISLLSFLYKLRIIPKEIVIEYTRNKKLKLLEKRFHKTINKNSNIEFSKKEFKKENIIIWTCWLQGEEKAPLIVKRCLKSIKNNKNDFPVIIITEENFKTYVNIPEFIVKKWKSGIISNTHFSDILRCALLIQNGGIWIDSTCYLSDKIPDFVFENSFFCFKHKRRLEDTIELGSWFMYSVNNNPLLKMTYELENEYWKKYNELDDYFLFHIFFRISSKYYSEIWDFVPNINDMTPHELNSNLNYTYNKEIYEYIIRSSFVHKLTYKFLNIKSESILDKFLNGGIKSNEN